jgi:hypothetical protein
MMEASSIWPVSVMRHKLASCIGVSSQAAISAGETILFGECGFIVPAVSRGLSAAIPLAKSLAFSSVSNVLVLRAFRREPSCDVTV